METLRGLCEARETEFGESIEARDESLATLLQASSSRGEILPTCPHPRQQLPLCSACTPTHSWSSHAYAQFSPAQPT